ncbi:MAG: hemerythrin family protein [Rhodospirillaceae bacterium]
MVTMMVNYCEIISSEGPIAWSDDYRIGVGQIDGEHEALFSVYHEFISSLNSGAGQDAVKDAIIKLEDYIADHFTSEEELMISIEFPELFSHKLEHLDFQVAVTRFKKSVLRGEDVNQDFVKFFGHWLISHITIMDRRIGEFLRANPAG